MIMKKKISTPFAPAAIGPYSQAVKAGDFLYVSGQIPLSPETGEIVGTTIQEQTEQVFKNLSAILTEGGMTFDDVVKATVLLSDIGNFGAVNEIYGKYFNGEILPARAAFAVKDLPKGAMVEIELVDVVIEQYRFLACAFCQLDISVEITITLFSCHNYSSFFRLYPAPPGDFMYICRRGRYRIFNRLLFLLPQRF